jgi:ABC-type oligopeptide transport system substrate-binding subunit
LRKASTLLQEAGCTVIDGKRHSPQRQPITVKFLLDEPAGQPAHMPFIKNLATLGIEATVRVVDPVQFRARLDDFDFDITVQQLGFSTLPGVRCCEPIFRRGPPAWPDVRGLPEDPFTVPEFGDDGDRQADRSRAGAGKS